MKRILTHNLYHSAEKFPQNIAFKQQDKQYTYEALIANSNKLAQLLIDVGVRHGDRVGIFMNRSIQSAVAVYGILMARAVYVPIDTNLPHDKIVKLLSDCDISIIISNQNNKSKLSSLCEQYNVIKHVIGFDNQAKGSTNHFTWDDVVNISQKDIDINNKEDDRAYIIYTSGTTGNPKGIVHTNYSGASYAKLSGELYKLNESDILGNHSHLHYDISTMGYLTMPYVGGCTVIIPEAHTKFPTSLAKLIQDEGLTIWYSVPLALIQLVQNGSLEDKDLSKLRWILFGGESFATSQINDLMESLPHSAFSNVYGPAEVNQCTYYNFNKDSNLPDPIPLGALWQETYSMINPITEDHNKGELLIASSTQMQGYWNQDKLNQDCFTESKDQKGILRRYYKTGDIITLNENNELVFIGRKDRQIKLRGYRIELNEIENLLVNHPHIKDAAVYTTKIENSQLIHAAVITDNQTEINKEIRKYLSDYLPSYSIPEKIHCVTSIPRTSAGKIDYKSLTT